MILLAFGDFAGQKEILEQDRGISLYCFFLRNVATLFGDDPPVSVVYSVVSSVSSTI